MKKYAVITFDKGYVKIWATVNHHDLIDVVPYFMKMNDPYRFYVVDSRSGKERSMVDIYYNLKKVGYYEDLHIAYPQGENEND